MGFRKMFKFPRVTKKVGKHCSLYIYICIGIGTANGTFIHTYCAYIYIYIYYGKCTMCVWEA